MLEERRIDLKELTAPRFSFGSATDLHRFLGVRPGSVTPFALLNDVRHLFRCLFSMPRCCNTTR
jgi:Ala-tRNA(Pro) deacylase